MAAAIHYASKVPPIKKHTYGTCTDMNGSTKKSIVHVQWKEGNDSLNNVGINLETQVTQMCVISELVLPTQSNRSGVLHLMW